MLAARVNVVARPNRALGALISERPTKDPQQPARHKNIPYEQASLCPHRRIIIKFNMNNRTDITKMMNCRYCLQHGHKKPCIVEDYSNTYYCPQCNTFMMKNFQGKLIMIPKAHDTSTQNRQMVPDTNAARPTIQEENPTKQENDPSRP